SYQVTLTVTDDRGLSASTTQLILVLTTANPSASFTFSPTTPAAGDTVFFNASGSRPADGRRIVSYFWTFGDGATGSGVTTSHPYLASGNFTPTLTVTDDLGKTATSSALVIVGSSQTPTASFVYSPANPTVNQTITFDASPSTAPQGRTIVSYAWRFGDGATGSGRVVQHSYPTPQDYVVVLTVTDSAGATNTTSRTVGVGSGAAQNPTADFTVSPSPAKSGQTVTFDGSLSKASAGATIVQYRWNFGDGTPTFVTAEPVTNHTYVVLNSTTFTITLTVVDSNGRTASSFKTLTVDP
ncbi:MAG: PKD domain-containing protein, partial [Acidobacteria bacterium]|nr:PKD domain-containing protein [Acidobacteriota bacterium]